MNVIIAQALIEKGALDGIAAGIASFFYQTTATVQEKPYLLIVPAVVLFFLLKPKRR